MARRPRSAAKMTDSEVLDAFRRVVAALRDSTLWKNDELRAGFAISAGPGVHVHERQFPDLERLRSLMLDFRKLIAEGEPTNINAVANRLHRQRHPNTDAILAAKARFNELLDIPMPFSSGDRRPSVRQHLLDWINGDWFHSEPEARDRRLGLEIVRGYDLSLAPVIASVREAIAAALELERLVSDLQPHRFPNLPH